MDAPLIAPSLRAAAEIHGVDALVSRGLARVEDGRLVPAIAGGNTTDLDSILNHNITIASNTGNYRGFLRVVGSDFLKLTEAEIRFPAGSARATTLFVRIASIMNLAVTADLSDF